jgi:hypothetical protein
MYVLGLEHTIQMYMTGLDVAQMDARRAHAVEVIRTHNGLCVCTRCSRSWTQATEHAVKRAAVVAGAIFTSAN